MCINFNTTPFDLKGMLQQIFDCLYITDNTSAVGIKHLFFTILVRLNLHLIGLMGALYLLFFLVIDWPRGGQRLLAETYLLMPCFEELCCVDHQTVLTTRRRGFFFFFFSFSLTAAVYFSLTSKSFKKNWLLLPPSVLYACMCGVLLRSQL